MQNRLYITAVLTGILLHAIVFSRHEWDRHAPRIVIYAYVLYVAAVGLLIVKGGFTFGQSILETLILGAALLSGLFGSMVTYRLFLHPLHLFPGPLVARLTSFWVIQQSIPDLKFYVKLRGLHDRYGDFVRIRPREVSICHPDAVIDVHGPRSRIRKGEWYDLTYPHPNLQAVRDPELHRKQRPYWDKAFQSNALQEYTPRLAAHYKILMSMFDSHATLGTSVDASGAFLDLFFDVISDLTFGKSFNGLTTKQRSPIVEEFLKRQRPGGFLLLHIPILHIVRQLSMKTIKKWEHWYEAALEARKTMRTETSDIYTYLSKSDGFMSNLVGEAELIMVAGADTNAITITNVCYLMCRHPEYQTKLYEELAELPTIDGIIDDQHLVGKPYLTGIINEALRLHPPAPSGVQRLTPPEGAVIAGRYIPGDIVVTTPTYSLHRDPRTFARPNDFIPERWSSKPELVLRKEAFLPFGYGAYNCSGKPLAMLQLRMVVAMIFKQFEVSFAPDKELECQHFVDHQADCFTLHLEPLPLLLKKRQTVD
ncbi:cytochrome P450 [Decorospora gaudefroyi]|uniref:Cytochrome P450 n=1 Tax=Decorospora gaudefroyi TaxID=184978 RepID=A0A6A5K2Y2_9PLEO|nr:cytochrome P450 [Decorospora gaudefroyi]